ncbi:MAG: glutamate--tRNA ligase [Ignavibacteria bacterium]|nr:glutamate--tRNA ligase [Ignavibacteria bacterium]
MKEVRVRFAPSPTGFLHVGGARTAIFNWLFARNQKGKFLLRIEDTDPERSRGELSEQILRSMRWLGMDGDEPIVYQALNIDRHREVALELLKRGSAYYAFETPEELEAQRKEASAAKRPFKYNRASLKLDKETIDKYLAEGKPYAIRFKVPDGATEFEDIVHGQTTFKNSEIDDFVLLRSDGSPVYQLAVVVDDHDMNITHVIRGDDHLSNTPKQILLFRAMDWDVPLFAHLPMILDEEKKKLSKRRNPVSVEEYKQNGYLSEALFNFLTLLGFAPPLLKGTGSAPVDSSNEKQEIVSIKDLQTMFTFDRVNKKSAVFDMKKLGWINSEYIKKTEPEALVPQIKEVISRLGIPFSDTAENEALIHSVVALMKERVQTVNEFVTYGRYFFTAPDTYDEKGILKHWTAEIKDQFITYSNELAGIESWDAEFLEQHLREFAVKSGLKAGQLVHPLRLALTGQSVSPGIFEVMVVLGKSSVIGRITGFIQKNR